MAKKRKLRKESTSDLGVLLGLGYIFVSLCVTRSSPLAVALWLISLLAVFIRCAMRGNDDRIMGFPGLAVVIGILMPMRGASHYMDSGVPFVWVLPIGMVLSALFCLSVWRKEQRQRPWENVLVCLACSAVIFLLASLPVMLVNTAFDGSAPRQMTAAVTEKYKRNSGKGCTVKHVVVAVPGENEMPDFTVPLNVYNAIHVGDEVTVTRHEGFLGSPWWEIEP